MSSLQGESTDKSSPKQLLKALMEYLGTVPVEPDRNILASLLCQDIKWTFPGSGKTFASGTHEGIDAVVTLLSAIFSKIYNPDTFEYQFIRFLAMMNLPLPIIESKPSLLQAINI